MGIFSTGMYFFASLLLRDCPDLAFSGHSHSFGDYIEHPGHVWYFDFSQHRPNCTVVALKPDYAIGRVSSG
ncbi:hypothetical protein ASPFODRAFT_526051 [Aspergillus luchuensis CBS 106.47]|uniref:Uncharacterized protein n=1 Tax=Aspergillus luchuensis (strain CBS 106.47) TaxID=1137211 RepID=A0A1M3TMV8_ASPLC|nr:hypothetical protein ASPFODRAFT_526051 [Aspergillus luchuensis CBS 106.47]